jgi:nucleoside-diphosphate-sugar epimerase
MSAQQPVVILGAGGFIGRALALRLAAHGFAVHAVTRSAVTFPAGIENRQLGTLTARSDWAPLLAGAGAIVHLASRAHMAGPDDRAIAEEAATVAALARASRAAGIARTILLSSIKVLGAPGALPFSAASPPAPDDDYARLKAELETSLRDNGAPGLVVLRPPLVYGPGVKGNFRALLKLADSGWPLPLGGIANRRAFLYRDNLLGLIELGLSHAQAPGGVFLARDDEEISTSDLVARLARAFGRRARLFAVPPALLGLAGHQAAARLTGSLSIDDSATRRLLGWRPKVNLDQGLAATARWYRGFRQYGEDAGSHL